MNISFKVRILNFFRNIFRIKLIESFLISQTQNKLPYSLVCKLVPNPYQYAHGTFRTIHRNGLFIQVDISDYIGHYLYFGFLDSGIQNLFGLCQKNFNVIDVGTNIGWVALNFARLSESGRVIGFEPDPYNYSVCKSNSDRNALPNLTILPYALGETSSQVMMEVRTPDNRGGNRIAPKNGSGSVNVQIKRLDDIEEIASLSSINLVKLDVEGYELKVLRGAHATIQKHKPILFIEVDDDNLLDQGDSAKGLVSFLEANGYESIVHAETNERITSSKNFSHCHFDIIAR
ncbi:MAG: FkbM family methyltransferase [Cyclobacteriaceae bacterium]|nr:FkbM family methyltransferase [Cyclobacteriaceae bacterium]